MMMLSVYGLLNGCKSLVFLSEIHKLLGVVDKDDVRCSDMYEFVSQKVDEVQQQIRDLMRVENMLNDLKECCPNEEYLYSCPIIEKMFEG